MGNLRKGKKRIEGWCEGGLLFDLGVSTYNKQINYEVFNGITPEVYDKYFYNENFTAVQRKLLDLGTDGAIVSVLEADCNIGLLVDPESMPECEDRGLLYERYNMTGWANEVN